MIQGLSHITLTVKNLDRTARMLRFVLDAEEVYSSGGETFSLTREKFFLIGGVWLAIMEGKPVEERSYNHIAFKIREEELAEYRGRINSSGLEIKEGRTRVEGEGRSLYFYDFDNHLFELHTATLAERLARYGVSEKSGSTGADQRS